LPVFIGEVLQVVCKMSDLVADGSSKLETGKAMDPNRQIASLSDQNSKDELNSKSTETQSQDTRPAKPVRAPRTAEQISAALLKQAESYFQDDYIMKDTFIQKQLAQDPTAEGYIKLKVMSTFNKIKRITKDRSLMASALKDSSILELSSDMKKVRRRTALDLPFLRAVAVSHLPKDATKDVLVALFQTAGNIERVEVSTDSEGQCTGTAQIHFETTSGARNAVQRFNSADGMRVKLLGPQLTSSAEAQKSGSGEDGEESVPAGIKSPEVKSPQRSPPTKHVAAEAEDKSKQAAKKSQKKESPTKLNVNNNNATPTKKETEKKKKSIYEEIPGSNNNKKGSPNKESAGKRRGSYEWEKNPLPASERPRLNLLPKNAISEEPNFVPIRQPKVPDGTTGFHPNSRKKAV